MDHSITISTVTFYVLLGALAVVGAAVGFTIAYLKFRTAGDEPPIRVKNGGSVHLVLETKDSKWTQIGTSKAWTHDGDPHPSKVYWAYVTHRNRRCSDFTNPVTSVRVTTNDGEELTFGHERGKRPRVKPNRESLILDNDTLLVSRPDSTADRYVAKIELWRGANLWSCTFNKDDFGDLLLCPREKKNVP